MSFSTLPFLLYFLPAFLIVYFLSPERWRNFVLLAGSLIFYACGEPVYLFVLLASIGINYALAQRICQTAPADGPARSRQKKETQRKSLLVLALMFNFGMLAVFKFLGLFFGLALPLGISFYTFQMASFVIDTYRGETGVLSGIFPFATYIMMFPKLTMGPITKYSEIEGDLKQRKSNLLKIEWGASVFALGLAYKVLLADKMATLWNTIQVAGVLGINTPTAWLGAWGYSMQIYFDFFGYSLMAVGLGHILGFRLPVNFRSPYCCKSATEFWRRWHITLGRWFREYVYIPLGGNRKGNGRRTLNLLIVWLLTGFWHGASGNFLIWGLFFFVLLFLEKQFYLQALTQSKVLGHLYMLVIIPVSWVIFSMTDLHQVGLYLLRMIGVPLAGSVIVNGTARFMNLLSSYWWLFLLCAVCCTPLPLRFLRRNYKNWGVKIVLLLLFWYSVYQISLGNQNPFMYLGF